jgi:hypothetical protein
MLFGNAEFEAPVRKEGNACWQTLSIVLKFSG